LVFPLVFVGVFNEDALLPALSSSNITISVAC
jgi:hypothetical protein